MPSQALVSKIPYLPLGPITASILPGFAIPRTESKMTLSSFFFCFRVMLMSSKPISMDWRDPEYSFSGVSQTSSSASV